VSVVSVCSTTTDKSFGVWLDGLWSQSLTPTSTGVDEVFVASLDGQPHLVEIVNGWQQYGNAGSFVRRLAFSGGSAVLLPNPSAARRLAVYGDSIANGGVATVLPRDGWIPRLRQTFGGRISLEGWGGRQLWDDSGAGGGAGLPSIAALAARLVGLCFDSGRKEIWDAIGTNDWGQSNWTAAAFGTALGTLYDAIHALDSSIRIYAQTPIITSAEAQANTLSLVIGDYRAAKVAAAATRTGWVVPVDGTSLMTTAGLDVGGIHPTTAGHATLATSIAAVLG
jgi:lysophospholipase L1-like esterase